MVMEYKGPSVDSSTTTIETKENEPSINSKQILDTYFAMEESDLEKAYLEQLAKGTDPFGLSEKKYPNWKQCDFEILLKGLDDPDFVKNMNEKIAEDEKAQHPKQREEIMSGPRPTREEIKKMVENLNISEKARDVLSSYLVQKNNDILKEKYEDPLCYRMEGDTAYDEIQACVDWSNGIYTEIDPVPSYKGYQPEDYATLAKLCIEAYKEEAKKLLLKKEIEAS